MAESAADAGSAGLTAGVLTRVPGLAHGEAPLAIALLPGGSTNRNAFVRTRLGAFVVRTNLAHGARHELDRRREALLQSAAAAAGFAPEVVWADPAGAVLISVYVPGRVWSPADIADARQLVRLGERLRELHALPAPDIVAFEAAATGRRYRGSIPARDSRDAAQLDAWVEEIAKLEVLLAAEHRPRTIIHGDLHCSNVLDGGELVLVDWEYAGLADPLYDLGCILAHEPAACSHALPLLAAAGLAGNATEESLARAMRLYELLSALWSRVIAAPPASGASIGETLSGAGSGESAD